MQGEEAGPTPPDLQPACLSEVLWLGALSTVTWEEAQFSLASLTELWKAKVLFVLSFLLHPSVTECRHSGVRADLHCGPSM